MRTAAAALLLMLIGWMTESATAQDSRAPQWQILGFGGVYWPIQDEVQNVYGSAPHWQLTLVAPLSDGGRLRVGGSHMRRAGDPYFGTQDFNAGDVATLSLTGLSMLLELSSKAAHNPRLHVGAGLLYYFGAEEIMGHEDASGDGLGAVFSLSPEFQVTPRLIVALQTSLNLINVNFRRARQRYDLNMSGAAISLGVGYRFGS